MASSTVGASTFIVWKRRSSAASFSIYLRYSFIVVAPTHCNSPRLSAGLIIFEASIAPTNYGIEFSLPRQFGQVTPKCAQCWSLDIFFRRLATFLLRFSRREVWVKFFKNLVAGAFNIEFETLEHSGSDAFAFAQKPKQNMFRADVGMIERLGFLTRERQYFFDPGRVRNV